MAWIFSAVHIGLNVIHQADGPSSIDFLIRNFRDESLSISWSKHDRWGMVILCRKSDCLLLYSIGLA